MRKRCSKGKEDSTKNDNLSDLSLSDPDDKSDLRMYLKSTKNSRSYKSRKLESKPNSRDSSSHSTFKQHNDFDRNRIRMQDHSDVSDSALQNYVKSEEIDSMKKSLDSDLDAYMIARRGKEKSVGQEKVSKQLTYTKSKHKVEKISEEKNFKLQKSVHTLQNRIQELEGDASHR